MNWRNGRGFDRRRFLQFSGSGLIGLALPGCKDDKTGPAEFDPNGSSVIVYGNPADPAIATVSRPDGRRVTYFGNKDTQGRPLNIRQTLVETADRDPALSTVIAFDAQARPISAQVGGGGSLGIEYTTARRAILTFRSANGQVEVKLPFENGQVVRKPLAALPVLRRRAALAPKPAAVTPSLLPARNLLSEMPGGRAATIRVTCGSEPVPGAVLTGSYRIGETGDLRPLAFDQVAPGVFEYSLPTAPASNVNVEAVCDFLDTAIGVTCEIAKTLGVTGLTVACASIAAGPYAVGIFAFCERIAIAVLAACEVIPDGAPVIIPCSQIQGMVDLFTTDTVRIFVTASHPALGKKDTILVAGGISSIAADTRIDLPAKASIALLSTNPADPAPGQGYRITALAQCAPAGTSFTLSIVGTDAYRDSRTTVLTQSNKTVTLDVPGADAGVQDTITARLGDEVRAVYILF